MTREKAGILARSLSGVAVVLLTAWACGGSTSSSGSEAGDDDDSTIPNGGSSQQDSGGSAGTPSAGAAGNPGSGGASSPSGGSSASSGGSDGSGGLIILIDGGSDAAASECEYYGVIYQDGDTFECHDRCNSCTCENGVVSSTLMWCPRCYDGDDVYLPDEVVETADDCRICICEVNLDSECTLEPCELVDGGLPVDASTDALPPTDGGVLVDAGADSGVPVDASADSAPPVDASADALPPTEAGTDASSDAGADAEAGNEGGAPTDASVDASADSSSDSGIEPDPGLLADTWYFMLPTGAIRWYQVVLCSDGLALQWTSFNGGGEPDQETPIAGSYVVESELVVLLEFPPSSGDLYTPYESLRLEYDPDSNTVTALDTVPEHFWGGGEGIPLGPISSMSYRLSCDGGFVAGAQ